MAESAEDICNLALLQIGHTTFIDTLGDDSEEARVCGLAYDQDLDEVLEAIPWPFATRRAKPAPLVATTLSLGAVPTGWAYAFAFPDDAVPKGLKVYPGTTSPSTAQLVPVAVEYDSALQSLVVLTNDSAPEFVYTSRVANPLLFDAAFVRALAWRISVDLALGLRKDPKVGDMASRAYQAALGAAVSTARRNVTPGAEPLPPHIAAR